VKVTRFAGAGGGVATSTPGDVPSGGLLGNLERGMSFLGG
jgi:hypothetical protein